MSRSPITDVGAGAIADTCTVVAATVTMATTITVIRTMGATIPMEGQPLHSHSEVAVIGAAVDTSTVVVAGN